MSDKNTGGPAFPIKIDNQSSAEVIGFCGETVPPNSVLEYRGMSLRDYFAAKAMQGLLLDDNGDFSDSDWLAEQAYKFADAMLKASES